MEAAEGGVGLGMQSQFVTLCDLHSQGAGLGHCRDQQLLTPLGAASEGSSSLCSADLSLFSQDWNVPQNVEKKKFWQGKLSEGVCSVL